MSTRTPGSNNWMTSPQRKKPRNCRKEMTPRCVNKKPTLFSMVLSSSNKEEGTEEETTPSVLAPSPIEMLPDEVLGKCFFSGFVNSMDIIANMTYVSKRTTEVARKSVKMLDLRALPQLTAADIQTIVRRHANLSELDFGYCPQFGREHLMALVAISETLRSLKLRGSALCNDDIVAYLDSVTEHLEGSPSRLQELDLSAIAKGNTSKIGDVAVSMISECCPELRKLQLGWCKRVSNKSLPSLKNLRRLTELDLSLTSITDEGCSELAQLDELKKLDLSATGLGDEGIRLLLDGNKRSQQRIALQELRLRFNGDMTEKSLSLLAIQMPTLKSLDIGHCQIEKGEAKEAYRQLKQNGTKIED